MPQATHPFDLTQLPAWLNDVAVFVTDPRDRILAWTDGAAKLYGYQTSEILGLPASTIETAPYGPADPNDPKEQHGWAKRKDRSHFWCSERRVPAPDASGAVLHVVRDITAWHSAAEERSRIFNLSADLVCVAGFDGYFKRINPSFKRVLGYDEAEILGRPFMDFVHPDDRAATEKESTSLASGHHDGTISFQNRYRRSDGTYCWLDWRSNGSYAERLIYAIARDITAQKAMERLLGNHTRELERSNAELQQFAYVASHDLQEPLRAVAGCVHMLGENLVGKLDERDKELIDHAIDGAKRMQSLIEDLLAFSRVGVAGVEISTIDPHNALDAAMYQLQVSLAESGATVNTDPLPAAPANPTQLTQLFQNLIGNALKFRGQPAPVIKISAADAGDEIIFSVQDNGIGIDPQYHQRIFGVFQRLHGRKAYKGTGIGLAICKKIVDQHGGRIWVESQPGTGATFRFSLPKHPPDAHNSQDKKETT